VALLEKQKNVKADRLSDRFGVSETTIQKDLVALEKKGSGQRDSNGETYAFQTQLVLAHRENAIARLALNYIAEGLTLLLDAGSTALSLARALRGNFQTLCIITNSIPVALELSKTNYKILLTGGEVADSNLALIGSAATKTVQRYHADCTFLGSSSVLKATGNFGQLSAPVDKSPRANQWVPSNFTRSICRIG
jgi:DeoR/GlpR family transcriptional regulator of sugar metabolism